MPPETGLIHAADRAALTPGWFLRAPLPATQQTPDAGGPRGEAKVTRNNSSNTAHGPACMTTTVGAGALVSEGNALGSVGLREAGVTARMPFGVQACFPGLGAGIAPATDGTGRRLHLARHLAKAPASVQQGHGHTTTDCEWEFGACGSYTHLSGTTSSFL